MSDAMDPSGSLSNRLRIEAVDSDPVYVEPLRIPDDAVLILPGDPLVTVKPHPKDATAPKQVKTLEDFTILVPHRKFQEALQAAKAGPESAYTRPSLDFAARIRLQDHGKESLKPCRVHAALAFGGDYYSVTLRELKIEGLPESLGWWIDPEWKQNLEGDRTEAGAQELWKRQCLRLGWRPQFPDRAKSNEDGYFAGAWRMAGILHKEVFGDGRDPNADGVKLDERPVAGLVLVTGGTGSGKTALMNLMLARYLCGILGNAEKRRPHIVALGDPVETPFFFESTGMLAGAATYQIGTPGRDRAFDYTVRILGKDSPSVSHALKDALRETPSAYIISELREKEDFESAFSFATTGHLVIATAHSTSLVDSMSMLLRIAGASTPNQRAALARRLKALVHLTPLDVTCGGRRLRATLPSIWRGTSTAARNFVSDGLASLLPKGRSQFDRHEPASVLGLAHAAAELAELHGRCTCVGVCDFAVLLRLAQERDLEVR